MTPDFLDLAKAEASVRPYFDKPDHLNSDGGHDAEYQISSLFHYRDNIGRKNYRLLNLLRHLPSVVIKKGRYPKKGSDAHLVLSYNPIK